MASWIREATQPSHWRPKTTKSRAQAIDADHPFALRVRDAYSRALGVEPVVSGCPGVTIAMVLIERGIPAVICGPGSVSKAHTEDEYVPRGPTQTGCANLCNSHGRYVTVDDAYVRGWREQPSRLLSAPGIPLAGYSGKVHP